MRRFLAGVAVVAFAGIGMGAEASEPLQVAGHAVAVGPSTSLGVRAITVNASVPPRAGDTIVLSTEAGSMQLAPTCTSVKRDDSWGAFAARATGIDGSTWYVSAHWATSTASTSTAVFFSVRSVAGGGECGATEAHDFDHFGSGRFVVL